MKRILLIDDEEILIRSYVKLLEKKGHDPFFVKCGEDALEIIEEVDFDLIICDVRMPGMGGVETVSQIRTSYENSNKKCPPVIIITGYADDEAETKISEMGIERILRKPFDINDFSENVQSALTRHRHLQIESNHHLLQRYLNHYQH